MKGLLRVLLLTASCGVTFSAVAAPTGGQIGEFLGFYYGQSAAMDVIALRYPILSNQAARTKAAFQTYFAPFVQEAESIATKEDTTQWKVMKRDMVEEIRTEFMQTSLTPDKIDSAKSYIRSVEIQAEGDLPTNIIECLKSFDASKTRKEPHLTNSVEFLGLTFGTSFAEAKATTLGDGRVYSTNTQGRIITYTFAGNNQIEDCQSTALSYFDDRLYSISLFFGFFEAWRQQYGFDRVRDGITAKYGRMKSKFEKGKRYTEWPKKVSYSFENGNLQQRISGGPSVDFCQDTETWTVSTGPRNEITISIERRYRKEPVFGDSVYLFAVDQPLYEEATTAIRQDKEGEEAQKRRPLKF